MKNLLLVVFLLCSLIISGTASPKEKKSKFGKFEMLEFDFKGQQAKIVFPEESNKGKHWIWRARFWGHEPQTDLELLKRGFHLVYVDVADLYGNQKAVGIWNDFYNHVTGKYQLNKKVVLEGMSRGGLIVYAWAARNLNKVACIYADAPVCDIKSWPGGLYKGKGSKSDWEKCLKAHKLNEETVLNYPRIPVFCAMKVAKAGIPAIHVCGADDKIVPYEENTKKLAENYRKAGGEIEIILKEGVGHHPHSLKNPEPIVDFILKHTTN